MNLATLQAALVAKAIADTSATLELAGPLARRALLSAGQTGILPFGAVAGYTFQSNQAHAVALIRLAVIHRLADPANEDAYLDSAFATDTAILLDRRWWKVVEAYDVLVAPELVIPEGARIGNVIEYEVASQLRFIP